MSSATRSSIITINVFGRRPLWNPYSNCSAPFLAQWGTMVLYPFSLIYLLFPAAVVVKLLLPRPSSAGGNGNASTHRWVKPVRRKLAGFAFIFNRAFSGLIWPNYLVALAWMPFRGAAGWPNKLARRRDRW